MSNPTRTVTLSIRASEVGDTKPVWGSVEIKLIEILLIKTDFMLQFIAAKYMFLYELKWFVLRLTVLKFSQIFSLICS